METHHIASAIIRKDEQILMVQQPDDDGLYWFIPGGVMESGESINDALIREVREETGLKVDKIGKLAYVTQINNAILPVRSIAFIVEIEAWSGILAPDDPDDLTYDVAFVPIPEAINRLDRAIWTPMREPLQAYLRQEKASGKVWQYHQHSFREFELLTCI